MGWGEGWVGGLVGEWGGGGISQDSSKLSVHTPLVKHLLIGANGRHRLPRTLFHLEVLIEEGISKDSIKQS